MNSYVDQYDEMKLFFDKIRKEVEIKPHDEVELRTIMSNLNQFGVKNAGEKIEYPMLNRRDIFQDTKDQTCYLSKGSFFPPYIELSVNDKNNPHRKLRNYEIIVPVQSSCSDTVSILFIDYLLEHKIPAEMKVSTHHTNANIRIFVETEQAAKQIRKYCLRQPLIYLNIMKPNPFLKRFHNDIKFDEIKAFGFHKNPYGAGMESIEYIAVLICEYIESARLHDRIEFITIDKFMSSLKKRVQMYRDNDPKKMVIENLLSVYNKEKTDHKGRVEIKNILTKGSKKMVMSSEDEKNTSMKPYSYYQHENLKEKNHMMSKEYMKNVYPA